MAPPRVLKDKHIKLRVAAGLGRESASPDSGEGLTHEAVLATPRCHPDGAAIRREERRAAEASRTSVAAATSGRDGNGRDWRRNITFDALGWHMAERVEAAKLLAGDSLDIAFTIGHNDHPEYGGIELSLRDFKI